MKKSFISLISAVFMIFSVFSIPIAASDNISAYSGSAYAEINDNIPYFTKQEMTTKAFENYSELDELGRCGVAYANICKELMPVKEREAIGMIKPSGWQTVKYNGLIDGNYLYNRCHLIGFQLAGENANEKNLITGTRYLNVEGMLPFENQVADYVKKTDNHVLYRVTPIFENSNLVASGVQIEAYSVEDKGKGVCFNVYCYNVQPGIEINYATGKSKLSDKSPAVMSLDYSKYALRIGESKTLKTKFSPVDTVSAVTWRSDNNKIASVSKTGKVTALKAGTAVITAETSNGLKASCVITVKNNSDSPALSHKYILNTSSKKIHLPTCSSVKSMSEKNKAYTDDYSDAVKQGYEPCKICNPR